MSITDSERETYTDVFQSVEAYRNYSPGEEFLPAFLEMSGVQPIGTTVLDAGCGTGKGGLALAARGFEVMLMDLTDEGLVPEARALPFMPGTLWRPSWIIWPEVAYCCDVMEHLPTAFTMLVANNLIQSARIGTFFSISLIPDTFGVWVGKPLHQTVQSFTWWRDHLRELGTVKECRDLQTAGLYWVTR